MVEGVHAVQLGPAGVDQILDGGDHAVVLVIPGSALFAGKPAPGGRNARSGSRFRAGQARRLQLDLLPRCRRAPFEYVLLAAHDQRLRRPVEPPAELPETADPGDPYVERELSRDLPAGARSARRGLPARGRPLRRPRLLVCRDRRAHAGGGRYREVPNPGRTELAARLGTERADAESKGRSTLPPRWYVLLHHRSLRDPDRVEVGRFVGRRSTRRRGRPSGLFAFLGGVQEGTLRARAARATIRRWPLARNAARRCRLTPVSALPVRRPSSSELSPPRSASSRPCSSRTSSARRRSADSQDPERTRVVLDRFYDAMAAEIERAGGTVEKFVGDAVMAAFGAPAALEDHAERALHAALAMQRRLRELFGDRLALRIGVNTGEVVVGRPREGSSFVTGDAVNVAARLEQAATPGEILVGERTAAAVRGAFELGEPRNGRGEGEAGRCRLPPLVRALSLMRPARGRRAAAGLRRAGRASSSVCGRRIARGVERGEPRPGDDRRRRRSRQDAAGARALGVARRAGAAAASAHRPLPLVRAGHHVLAAGRGAAGALRHPRERSAGGRRASGSATAVPRLDARARRRGRACTRSWRASGSTTPGSSFLDELVAERPTRAAVEDVHWAEDELLDLLDTLVATCAGRCSCSRRRGPRFSTPHPAGARRDATVLRLEPLLADATPGGCSTSCSAPSCPSRCAQLVVERAEGNPFFVEELIATLIDTRRARAPTTAAGRSASCRRASAFPTRFRRCSPRASTCCRPRRRRRCRRRR